MELNTDAFDRALATRQWTMVRAAQELGVDRATLYRLMSRDVAPSAVVIGRICTGLAYHGSNPEALFPQLFTIVPTTKMRTRTRR